MSETNETPAELVERLLRDEAPVNEREVLILRVAKWGKPMTKAEIESETGMSKRYVSAEISAGNLPATAIHASERVAMYLLDPVDVAVWLANPKRGSRSKKATE
jgi:hypothetical protein